MMESIPTKFIPPKIPVRLGYECPICFEEIYSTDVRWLPCCHVFHPDCVKRWFATIGRPECPVCRAQG